MNPFSIPLLIVSILHSFGMMLALTSRDKVSLPRFAARWNAVFPLTFGLLVIALAIHYLATGVSPSLLLTVPYCVIAAIHLATRPAVENRIRKSISDYLENEPSGMSRTSSTWTYWLMPVSMFIPAATLMMFHS